MSLILITVGVFNDRPFYFVVYVNLCGYCTELSWHYRYCCDTVLCL